MPFRVGHNIRQQVRHPVEHHCWITDAIQRLLLAGAGGIACDLPKHPLDQRDGLCPQWGIDRWAGLVHATTSSGALVAWSQIFGIVSRHSEASWCQSQRAICPAQSGIRVMSS